MVRYCTNNTKSLHSPASHHYFPRLWYRYFECGGKRTSDKLHGNPDANSHFHPHFNPSPYSYAYASSNGVDARERAAHAGCRLDCPPLSSTPWPRPSLATTPRRAPHPASCSALLLRKTLHRPLPLRPRHWNPPADPVKLLFTLGACLDPQIETQERMPPTGHHGRIEPPGIESATIKHSFAGNISFTTTSYR